jgi:adenine-specific DNA-methyltransferase
MGNQLVKYKNEFQKIEILILDDITKNNTKHFWNIESYYNMTRELAGQIVKVTDTIMLKSLVFEISFFNILSLFFYRKFETKIGNKIKYDDFIKKIDADNKYCWYEVPESINTFMSTLINEIIDKEKGIKKLNFISDFYQYILSTDEKRRLGQFYTPAAIVKYMINDLKIRNMGINQNVTIMDPACGAGIFFLEIVKRLKKKIKGIELAQCIYNSFYANDINPLAVFLTKLNLSFEILNQITNNEEIEIFFNDYFSFKNIRNTNTIAYVDENNYDYIVGNPPYFKLKNSKFINNEYYQDVIFGQPNIYMLFTYWAMKHVKENGKIGFILPQSFKSGYYFKELRKKLYNFKIISLTSFKSKTKVFKGVDQPVIILTIQNSLRAKDTIKVTNVEENDLDSTISFDIVKNEMISGEDYDFYFFVPKEYDSSDLLEKIYNGSTNKKELNDNLIFGNGLFVWNQHKKLLTENTDENTVPIIYSNAIDKYTFNFNNVLPNKVGKKTYVLRHEDINKFILSGKRLLVQRTSTINRSQRIKATVIKNDFLNEYPFFLVENHVNFLFNKSFKQEIIPDETIYFYCALLNSAVLNYVFGCKNGNNQVSATELNLLPIHNNNKSEIVRLTSQYFNSGNESIISQIEEAIFDNYQLNGNEIDIILRCRE